MTDLNASLWRSPLTARFKAAGATFRQMGDAAIVATVPPKAPARVSAGTPTGAPLTISDLTPLPRFGVKGPNAHTVLRERGFAVPDGAAIGAARQANGSLYVALGAGEAIVLSPPHASSGFDDGGALAGAAADGAVIAEPGAYFVPRRDSQCWLMLKGDAAASVMAKICAVNLNPKAFPDLSVAMTSVAKISAIVIRDDYAGTLTYHLLADRAASLYFFDSVVDAADEFRVALAGIDDLESPAHYARSPANEV